MEKSLITHVRYAAQEVPNFKQACDFYGGIWGLTKVASDSGIAFYAAEGSTEPYVLRLREGAEKHFEILAFGVANAIDVDTLAERLLRNGVKIDTRPGLLQTPGGGYGLRFFDCDGRLVEVSADVQLRQARELEAGESIPVKLSHIVINTENILATKKFYEDNLGFRLTDWLSNFMCFMRVGPVHHVIAITQGPHVSLNHVSFEMRGIDEYMRGTGRMMRYGLDPLWGPGRHGPGNNTFSYFADPNGNVCEYTTDLEVIKNEENWVPRCFETTPEASDQWGTGGNFEEYIPYALNDPDKRLWMPSPI
ncbi:VOC family protein [Streptomyces solaniscabiei]|uniref:VOC family protein n=1 Tax=Streptomyces solaniscabiei TaxID=2683255 RepID=UPI001CE34414|nr:VOC family protein [Streptomyces solaniscabiei]